MVSENERVVRRIFELFNQLDPDPEVRDASPAREERLDLPELQVDAGVFHGRDAFMGVWAEWLNVWEQHRSEITEVYERGDSLLVFNHNRFKGRDGLELEMKNQAIFTLAGGRVTQMRAFFDEQAARAAFDAREDV